MNWFSKILLFPLSLLFGLGVRIRLWLYKHHFLGSTDFDIPVICVGNLSVGGNGKTPMIEYLISVLQNQYPVGVISRGYARKTSGFIRVSPTNSADEVGDEPLLLKIKHRSTEVAVGEARVIAIPRLISEATNLKVLLMDDGYQHLSVRPHVNILLTTYQNPFWNDHLMPLGTLREFPSAKERANIIIVTKCPNELTGAEKNKCIEQINPGPQQKVFFSALRYGKPYLLFPGLLTFPSGGKLIAFTGIADAALFLEQLSKTHEYIHFEFDDHHSYTVTELARMARNYPDEKIWITTEKDAVRLYAFRDWFAENSIQLYVLPVAVDFLSSPYGDFSQWMNDYLAYYYPQPHAKTTDSNDAK